MMQNVFMGEKKTSFYSNKTGTADSCCPWQHLQQEVGEEPLQGWSQAIERLRRQTDSRCLLENWLVPLWGTALGERVHGTYAEKWTGATDRVRVNLTHGLVVEQGYPEETEAHTKKHMVLLLLTLHISLTFIDSLTPLHITQCDMAAQRCLSRGKQCLIIL